MTDAANRPFLALGPQFELERLLRALVRLQHHEGPVDDALAEEWAGAHRERDLQDLRREAGMDGREEAQDLAFEALLSGDAAKGEALAARALALDPHNLDACTAALLFTKEPPLQQVERLRNLLADAERRVDPFLLHAQRGRHWSHLSLRPLLRLRAGLAAAQARASRKKLAIAAWEDLLAMDLHDHLGARFQLLPLYAAAGQGDGLVGLADRFAADPSPVMAWIRPIPAVLAGDQRTAEHLLIAARTRNPHVEALLVSKAKRPRHVKGQPAPGSLEEAVEALPLLAAAWNACREAMVWLVKQG